MGGAAGAGSGGFYSYDQLKNLAGADIHNVERMVPEMQHLKVGDFVPMAPVEWGVPTGGFTVVRIEPEQAIVWRQGWRRMWRQVHSKAQGKRYLGFRPGRVGEGTTRLLLRERSGHKPHVSVVFHYLFMERPSTSSWRGGCSKGSRGEGREGTCQAYGPAV